MRRVLLARPEYFLDIFLVDAGQSRRIDWVYHNSGTASMTLTGQPVSLDAEGDGYQHIDQALRATELDDFTVTWQMASGGLRLFAASGERAEAILGRTPGNSPDGQRGTLIHRRQARATAFLSLFHPYQDAPRVTHVEWIGRSLWDEGWVSCVVHCAGRQEQWLIRRAGVWPTLLSALELAGAERFEYTLNEEPR